MMNTTTATATQAKVYFHIRFQGTRGQGLWVTGAKFADGAGFGVKSVTHNADRSKAAPMSRTMAEAIAVQFPQCFVSVHTAHDGALHAEATAYVTAKADEARKARAAAAAEFNAMLAGALDVVPGLREVLGGRLAAKLAGAR